MERKVNIKHFDANKNNILYINEECPDLLLIRSVGRWWLVSAWKDFFIQNGCCFIFHSKITEKPNMKHGGFSVLETQISLEKGVSGHHCGLMLKYAVSVESVFLAFLPTTLILRGSFLRSKHARVRRLGFLRTRFEVRRRRGASGAKVTIRPFITIYFWILCCVYDPILDKRKKMDQ